MKPPTTWLAAATATTGALLLGVALWEVWTLPRAVHWAAATLKVLAALAALATAWCLWRFAPWRRDPAPFAAPAGAGEPLDHEAAGAVLDYFFEEAPVGLLLMDAETRILRLNPEAPRAAGREPGDHIGLRLDEVPHVPRAALEAVRKVAETHQPQHNVVVSHRDPDGSEHHMLASYFPIRLPSGQWLIGGLLQDVSYQRRIEQQRLDALAAAEQASRAKDQFLAKVSHELRSPLQVALSATELLKRLPGMPPEARKFIDRLAHAIAMQARMINDLLDVSRILSGKLHVVNETLDPLQPLLRILDHWTHLAHERGVRLQAQGLEPDAVLVQADPARLEQVYANLLDNAIRFSQAGSMVHIGAHASRSTWRFFVRDFGAGMTADEVHAVFEPFAQGASQPKAGKGLGLGLAIVKSLVEAFDGRVWAESAGPGLGCTFVVELPLLMGDSTPPSSFGDDGGAGRPRLDGMHILYVEDEAAVALAMQAGLQRLGAEVEIAVSQIDAVQKLSGLPRLDAVVTDLNLGGGGSGHDVALALHDLPQHAHVPVLAVSAYGTREDVAATQAVGFADHLVKPVSATAVARAIRRALGT